MNQSVLMMNQLELPPDFIHESPKGYSYEVRQYKCNIISIWLCHHNQYNYNDNDSVATIWGFWDIKKQCYYAPINSTKHGNQVDIKDTRNYTAMQLNLNPLMAAFS